MISFAKRQKTKKRRSEIILPRQVQEAFPQEDGVDVTTPKLTHIQESMVSLEMAIQDNIVGITKELAGKYLNFYTHEPTGLCVTVYKDKPIMYSGFRNSPILGGPPEFHIECMGAISA